MSPELLNLYRALKEKTDCDEIVWSQASNTMVTTRNTNNTIKISFNAAPKGALALSAANIFTGGKLMDSVSVEIISNFDPTDKFTQTIVDGSDGFTDAKLLIISAIESIERKAALKLKTFLE